MSSVVLPRDFVPFGIYIVEIPNKITTINHNKYSCDNMLPSLLILSPELHQQLITLAKSWYPHECCAVIFGKIKNNREIVYEMVQIIEMENFAHSSVEFRIDELDLYSAIKQGAASGLTLLGIFHSHPDDAYLSGYDRRTIRKISVMYSDWIWVVYGNLSRSLKAYVFKNMSQFAELPIKKCI